MADVPGRPQSSAGTPDSAPVTGLPPELATLDAATRAVLEVSAGADGWAAATRSAVLGWAARHQDQVALIRARVLAAERDAGTWSLSGDRDLAGYAGRLTRRGRGEGAAEVAQAATLTELPTVAAALLDGPVTGRHVAELTRAGATSPALAAHLATAEGQARAVELAGRLDGARFGQRLRQWAAELDPAMRQRSHDEQRAARFLELTHTPGGTLLKGRLDGVAGYKLGKLLDAVTTRPALDDDRDPGQRRADALTSVVDRALSDQVSLAGPVAPVHALITFTESTWTALRARRTAAAQVGVTPAGAGVPVSVAGSARDLVPVLHGTDAVLDETGMPWPASEVGRALCDCLLTGAVVGSDGLPLHLGRATRLFTRAHWLGLFAAGQRTCAVDGCTMPLRWCELHHIRWWDRDGGSTDPANLAPECSYHHHEIHRLDLQVTRRADGSFEHRRPDGRRYGGEPPGGSALPAVGLPGGSALPAVGLPGGSALPAVRLPGRSALPGVGPPGG